MKKDATLSPYGPVDFGQNPRCAAGAARRGILRNIAGRRRGRERRAGPMVWSKWLGSLVVTMAWAGLALSQQPSPAPSPGERLLTLKEKGGNALRCRVIANWTMPEGGKAFQVQDVESGE